MNDDPTRNRDGFANLRLITHGMYALHLLSWLTLGVLSIAALVLNYSQRGALPNHFFSSHFRWQSRSFWYTLLWLLLSAPLFLLFVFPGYAAWFLIGIWYLYRFVKGWLHFAEGRAMPVETRDLDP